MKCTNREDLIKKIERLQCRVDELGHQNRSLKNSVQIENEEHYGDIDQTSYQQLLATEQRLRASNQQLMATEQQLRASNQQLEASNQQLKATTDMLLQSEELYRATFEQAAVGIARVGSGGEWLEVNQKLCNIVGYSRNELLITTFQDITHPDDLDNDLSFFNQMLADKIQTYSMEKRYFRKDGSIVWVNLTVGAERKPDRSIKYFISVIEDISDRKRAEEKLKESEKKLHTILDQNPFPIAVVDVDDEKIFYWSQSAIETFGHNPGNVSEWYELAYPDPAYREQVIKRWKPFVKKAFETKQPINAGEYNIMCQDGATKICEIYVQFIPGNMIVTLNDITERKKIEETLVKNESLFRGLYDNMTSGSAIYEVIHDGSKGSDYIVKNFNMKSLEIEGKTLDQVVGKSLYDLRPTIDDYGLIPVMKKVWETGKPDYFPIKIYEDEKFSNYYENYIFKIPTGEVVTIYNDVTDQKNSEIALKRSEERFAVAMEFANDGLFDWNLETNEIYYSPVWKRLLGYEDDELPNDFSVWEKLTHPEDVKRSWKMQKELINRQRDKFEIEFKMQHKDGHWVDILSRANAKFDENQKAVRIIGTHVDISQRKELEKKLLQSQKLESIGNLAGGIAHDFNNILSSIIGFTELALDETSKGTTLENSLQEVYSAGKRAKDLVKQILAFARQSEEQIGPVQPSVVAKEVLRFIRSTIPTTIEIQQEIESESLIMGNATQVHQVLMNLCTNAANAMEDSGGILSVSIEDVVLDKELEESMRPGDYVEIKVSDTGAGIAPEIIDSIFEPYFTTRGIGEGTGLGLAMAQGVIESYGGKIDVDSQLGKGTTFTIHLPISKKRSTQGAYVAEKLPTGTERILFVDDEAPIAKMGGQILERLGYSVTTRTSSIEALELFQAKPNAFDIVVTDMTMPNLTGDKLAVELMKIRSDIPVVLCTGYSKKISVETASEIGIKAFTYKPVVKADLAKTVRKVLDEAKG